MSQVGSSARHPATLMAIVIAFTAALGAGAYGLNRVVNPPPAQPTPSPSLAPRPASLPAGVAACPPGPSRHKPVTSPVRTYAAAPARIIDSAHGYCAYMMSNRGLITIRLRPDIAPITVNNFVFLARSGFYDGLAFHRVCPNPQDSSCGGPLAIAQGGDPKGNGRGGPGYSFADEVVRGDYIAGALAMANSGPNTNGSQFFICTGDDSTLPKSYNLFGQITDGLNIAQKLQKGDRMTWVDIEETPLTTPAPPPASPLPRPTPSVSNPGGGGGAPPSPSPSPS